MACAASQHVTVLDNTSTGVDLPADEVPIASSNVKIRGGERLTFSSEPVFLTLVSFFSRTGFTCTATSQSSRCGAAATATAGSHGLLVHGVAADDLFTQGVCACSHSFVTEASDTCCRAKFHVAH